MKTKLLRTAIIALSNIVIIFVLVEVMLRFLPALIPRANLKYFNEDLRSHIAKELGMDSLAITDHGNLYDAVEFLKKAKEKGVKPILGAEIYLAFEDMDQKRPKIDDTIYHLVVLVKNQKGYENLVAILTQGHLRGRIGHHNL